MNIKLIWRLAILLPILTFSAVAQQSYPGYITGFETTIVNAMTEYRYSASAGKTWWNCKVLLGTIVDFKTKYDWQVSGGCHVETFAPVESVNSLQKRIFSAMNKVFGQPASAIKLSKPYLDTGEKCFRSSLSVAGTFELGSTLTISFGLYRTQRGPFPPQGAYSMSIAISQGRPESGKLISLC